MSPKNQGKHAMNADKKSKKKAKNLAKNALNLSTNSKDKSKKNAQKSAKNLIQLQQSAKAKLRIKLHNRLSQQNPYTTETQNGFQFLNR